MIYWKHAEKVAQSFQGTHSPMPTSYGTMEVNGGKKSAFQREELKAKENNGWDAFPGDKKGPNSPPAG